MSKAGKIPASQFAASPAKSFRRVVGQRPKRRFFLIVCEGEKTEPNYFEAIRLKLPKDMIPKVFVRGTGKNTLSLIEEVEERWGWKLKHLDDMIFFTKKIQVEERGA